MQSTSLHFFLTVLLCRLLAATAVLAQPPVDTDFAFITDTQESVLFRVPSGKNVISCVGKFSNTEGNFDGLIRSAVRVRFGADAEGKANPCEVTLTTSPGPGQPPVVRTMVMRMIVPKIVSRTLAHVPGTTDDRTSIGVGEKVMFTAEPKEWLLDSDVAWRKGPPDDTISQRAGPATLYQAMFPTPSGGKRGGTTAGRSIAPVTLFIRDGAYEVALFADDAAWKRSRPSGKWRGHERFVSGEDHSPAALAIAYSAKLDRLEARLAAHGFSTEPVAWPQHDELHRQMPPTYSDAKGLDPILVALVSLQSRSAGGATGEQSETLQAREIRLVARMVYAFHRAVDPAYDLNKPRPYYFDPKLPPGATILPGHLNFEGRYEPKDIREPALRRQFAKAIAENNAKIAYHDKQYQADDADDTVRRFAFTYLQELCGRSDPHLKQYQRELVALGMDERTARKFSKKPHD